MPRQRRQAGSPERGIPPPEPEAAPKPTAPNAQPGHPLVIEAPRRPYRGQRLFVGRAIAVPPPMRWPMVITPPLVFGRPRRGQWLCVGQPRQFFPRLTRFVLMVNPPYRNRGRGSVVFTTAAHFRSTAGLRVPGPAQVVRRGG